MYRNMDLRGKSKSALSQLNPLTGLTKDPITTLSSIAFFECNRLMSDSAGNPNSLIVFNLSDCFFQELVIPVLVRQLTRGAKQVMIPLLTNS